MLIKIKIINLKLVEERHHSQIYYEATRVLYEPSIKFEIDDTAFKLGHASVQRKFDRALAYPSRYQAGRPATQSSAHACPVKVQLEPSAQ